MSNLFNSSNIDQILLLQQNIENINVKLIVIDQNIFDNITDIEYRIISNFSKTEQNLLINTSTLDSRIFANITSLKNDIKTTQIVADDNLLFNTTVLDWRIFNNISSLNKSIQNITQQLIDFNSSLIQQIEINQKQQNTINNLTLYINCTKIQGYSVINGSCVQVSCPIIGQQSINGFCQCTSINAIIEAGTCVCPFNSTLIGTGCVCSIIGQTIQNGQCMCSTIGAFVNNNACTCGINSLNISNYCSCPIGANLVNGICTCTQINAYISENQCVCPANSSLINNVCTCDQIIGQQMIDGTCKCSAGFSVVNNTCQQIIYIINTTNFECSQQLFTLTFDVQTITHYINTSSNFSSGYVFSSSNIIQDAYIDISDNIYSTTIYPLFQSQSIFMNLKIMFGKQQLNSGQFILPSNSIKINQMSIISRLGSQLTVSTMLNILTSSTANANITNLYVNLNFAPSSGRISLINNINGILNIFGYQILGSFISTQTVAMVGINLNSAIVNVDQINFKPFIYNVGNGSSYLFGNAITTSCTFSINNLAIILGNSSNFLLLGSSSSQSTYYLFGGIIAFINIDSTVNINNTIYDSYYKFSTNQVSNSGILIGTAQSSQNSILINNVCLQQNMTSITQFNCFGLIGWNQGSATVQNISILLAVQGTYFYRFEIIGYQCSPQAEMKIENLITTLNFNSNSGDYISSVFGLEEAKNCSVYNATVKGGNINSNLNRVGGFSGDVYSNMTIQNSTISDTNISGSTAIGGFIGWCGSTAALYLVNTNIQFVSLSGPSAGIIIGQKNGRVVILTSQSFQNYINNVQQKNCTNLSNWQVGC
ncbi:Conserved_hypothetical protein [Hexamita inflata]|uniref:Uncharacterized protein n=1 Tax=Hexamita inflata TaxID=28002 RepID=A0AA86R3D9_9EUKA|nr:Conserved hypothetical protein [Hexamita inflata]